MKPETKNPDFASDHSASLGARARSAASRILLYCLFLLIAGIAFVAYEHFKLHHQSTLSWVSLATAAGFALAPMRAAVRELFIVEAKILHLAHTIGGLALVGLASGGILSGKPLLSRAALAPFAIMGAAQAVMHQNHPRNVEQTEALRSFAASLPEVEQFTRPGNLSSPANARRAVAVITDLLVKAQALGETELRSDPGFQSALRRVTARSGLSLGLDVIDQAIGRLEAYPAIAGAIPGLRKRLAAVRETTARG